MGLLFKNDKNRMHNMIDVAEYCFYCGDPLPALTKQEGIIYWFGHTDETICLHPSCAYDLGNHLVADFFRHGNTGQ